MSILPGTVQARNSDHGVLPVKILAWVAVCLFLAAFLMIPRGITVFWSVYLLFYGPVILVDLAAILGFIRCHAMRRRVSIACLWISVVLLVAVSCDTWFHLRLRWYEVF